MKTGTKSLLFGAHWPLHPLQVMAAWRFIYGQWPTWREAVCIMMHDIGYAGCVEMDGPDGTMHPELGARLAEQLFGPEYGALLRGHSKGYAELMGVPLSKLYAADKIAHMFVWSRLYVARTRLTGELAQYRARTRGGASRVDDAKVPDEQWFRVVRARLIRGGLAHALGIIAPSGLGSDRGR